MYSAIEFLDDLAKMPYFVFLGTIFNHSVYVLFKYNQIRLNNFWQNIIYVSWLEMIRDIVISCIIAHHTDL